MRNFIRQSYYSYRGLFSWLPWASYVTIFVFGPVLTIIMFTLVGKFALGPAVVRSYVLGMVAQYIPFVLSGSISNCFSHERGLATLSTVYASRGNRAIVFFSRQLFHIPNGFVVVASGLFASWIFLGLDFGKVNWPALILAAAAITLSSCAVSAFLSNLTIVMDDWVLLYRLFAGAIIVLTGVIIPLSSLPAPLAAFSHVLPVTNALPAFKAAFDGSAIEAIWPLLAAELAVAAGYVVLGLAGYHLAEYLAKRGGIVETAA